MRTPRTLLALTAAVLVALLAEPAAARCRPSPGFTLARVGDGPVAPGGTVLLELRPVYDESQVIGLPLTAISVRRRGRRTPEHLTPRQLAANLFAFEVPVTAGHYMISPASLEIDVVDGAPAPPAPTTAPVLSDPPVAETRVGTGTTWPIFVPAVPPPAAAAGTILRWGSGSWFIPAGADWPLIGAGRCTAEVPGFGRVTPGETVSVRFVGRAGALGPEVTFTTPSDGDPHEGD